MKRTAALHDSNIFLTVASRPFAPGGRVLSSGIDLASDRGGSAVELLLGLCHLFLHETGMHFVDTVHGRRLRVFRNKGFDALTLLQQFQAVSSLRFLCDIIRWQQTLQICEIGPLNQVPDEEESVSVPRL